MKNVIDKSTAVALKTAREDFEGEAERLGLKDEQTWRIWLRKFAGIGGSGCMRIIKRFRS